MATGTGKEHVPAVQSHAVLIRDTQSRLPLRIQHETGIIVWVSQKTVDGRLTFSAPQNGVEKADRPNWFSGQLYVNCTVHPTIIELFSQEPGYVRLYRRKQR